MSSHNRYRNAIMVSMHERHPFEIFLLLAMLLVGGFNASGYTSKTGTLSKVVPGWEVRTWGILLIVGVLGAFGGILWKDRITGILIESIALRLVGYSSLAYTVAILASTPFVRGVGSSLIWLGFGLSCLVRARQQKKFLLRWQKSGRDNPTAGSTRGEG